MKNSAFWKYYGVLLFLIILTSCGYNDGDWGTTVGDCDEICTIYYTAQLELIKDREIYDRDFPDRKIRRKHVKEIENGHRIESWFVAVNEEGDTAKIEFSCEVYYNSEIIGYAVKNLKTERHTTINKRH